VDKSSPGFQINDDISRAETLPADVYVDLAWHERAKGKIFACAWQFIGEAAQVKAPGHVRPFTLLEGCLDEPLLLTVDENVQTHCLSNVCTHRGNDRGRYSPRREAGTHHFHKLLARFLNDS